MTGEGRGYNEKRLRKMERVETRTDRRLINHDCMKQLHWKPRNISPSQRQVAALGWGREREREGERERGREREGGREREREREGEREGERERKRERGRKRKN